MSLKIEEPERFLADWIHVALPAGAHDAVAVASLATVNDPHFPGAILPEFKDGEWTFYGVATSGEQWRELRLLLLAFAGPSTSDFQGLAHAPDGSGPISNLLGSVPGIVIARFSAGRDVRRQLATKSAVARLIECVSQAPSDLRKPKLPLGAAFSEFEVALAAGDKDSAERTLNGLQTDMRLDAMNLAFLRVRLLTAFQQWDECFASEAFARLAVTRRPLAVTKALLDCVYHVALRGHVLDSADDAVRLYETKIRHLAGTLLDSVPSGVSSAGAAVLLLPGFGLSSPNSHVLDAIRRAAAAWQQPPVPEFTRLLELTSVRSGENAPVASLEVQWDRELAAVAADATPASLLRARAVLVAAAFRQDAKSTAVALSYVTRLSAEDRQQLDASPGIASLLREFRSLSAHDQVPGDWWTWLGMLSEMTRDDAVRTADHVAAQSGPNEAIPEARAAEDLAHRLRAVQDAAVPNLRASLPRILSWLRQAEPWPNAEHAALYEVITDLLLLSELQSSALVGVLGAVVDARLFLGLDADDCTAMMKDIQDTLPDMLAPATLDAIIDLVETTLLYPCSCPESRMGLWSELCSRLRGWRGRLGTREFGVLKDIGVMLGGSELLDDSLLAAPALPPLGADRPLLRVLLYTLQDGVGERVTRLLAALAPHVRVQTSSALDGERRLRELAAGADIVVICWAAATHAATVAIQSVVADKRRIIYPSGKGSSSALRAIVDVAKAA